MSFFFMTVGRFCLLILKRDALHILSNLWGGQLKANLLKEQQSKCVEINLKLLLARTEMQSRGGGIFKFP